MSKGFFITLWILIGAIAAGMSTGYFLFQSTRDRAALQTKTDQVEQEVATVKSASERLANEANAKLTAAAKEVADAKTLIERLRLERELFAKAVVVNTPPPSVLKSWSSVISLPLGISFRFPSAFSATTSGQELTLSANDEDPWLSLQPFNALKENVWLSRLQKQESIIYNAGGQLFAGQKGVMSDAGSVYILHTLTNGTSTLLLWAKPENNLSEKRLFEMLSTVSIRP